MACESWRARGVLCSSSHRSLTAQGMVQTVVRERLQRHGGYNRGLITVAGALRTQVESKWTRTKRNRSYLHNFRTKPEKRSSLRIISSRVLGRVPHRALKYMVICEHLMIFTYQSVFQLKHHIFVTLRCVRLCVVRYEVRASLQERDTDLPTNTHAITKPSKCAMFNGLPGWCCRCCYCSPS